MKKRFLFVFVLMISMSVFSACTSENQFGIREKNDENMIKLERWGHIVSTIETNRITLTGAEESEFVCSTSSNDPKKEGKFLLGTHSGGTSVTVSSGTTIFWNDVSYDDEHNRFTAQNDTIWLEFINQKDSHIIGYAVVRVSKLDALRYEAEVMKSVTFPKVGGKYQDVTEEQVNELIDNVEES